MNVTIDIKESHNKENKLFYYGSTDANGITFTYKLIEQNSGKHIMRGEVRMLDSLGKSIRKKKEQDKPACPRDIYINEKSITEAKKVIEKAITILYEAYGIRIAENNFRDVSNCSFLTAVKCFGMKFLEQKKYTEDTIKRKIRELTAFASEFEPLEITSITAKNISAACRKYSTIKKNLLKTSEEFYYYCAHRSLFNGRNVFAEYNDNHYTRSTRTKDNLQNNQLPHKSLNSMQVSIINDEIEKSNPLDGRYTALILCMHCGLDINTIDNLKCQDLVFDNITYDSCQIVYTKSFTASSVINYTKPTTIYAARLLKKRMNEVKTKYGTLDMPVAINSKGMALTKTEIRNFFRKILKKLGGLGDEEQNMLSTINESSGGVTLLKNHYRYMLIKYCGLNKDPATLNFLCGKSLRGNVTNSYYRSYTDEEGQTFLFNLLKRIPNKRYIESDVRDPNVVTLATGETIMSYWSTDPERLTIADEIVITLHPNESVCIRSDTAVKVEMQIIGVDFEDFKKSFVCDDSFFR